MKPRNEDNGEERMSSTIDQNSEVFRDTMSWIQDNKKLSAAVEESVKRTCIFFDNDTPKLLEKLNKSGKITITSEKTFEAAIRLRKEYPNKKIAVMNYANAFVPGGGEPETNTQEECLCRSSTLYPVLTSDKAQPYYAYHREIGSDLATDSLIYSEDIVICKTDTEHPERMPENEWVNVDIITVAAPNLFFSSLGEDKGMSDKLLYDIHESRARHILSVAAYKGAEILVLGAFGCGVFCNDPYVVAKAYKDILPDFIRAFEEIRFAVFPENSSNFKAFSQMLGTEQA